MLSCQGQRTHRVTAKARHVSLSALPAHPIHLTAPGTEGDGSGEQQSMNPSLGAPLHPGQKLLRRGLYHCHVVPFYRADPQSCCHCCLLGRGSIFWICELGILFLEVLLTYSSKHFRTNFPLPWTQHLGTSFISTTFTSSNFHISMN